MKSTYMSQGDIMMASYNLKRIEKELGHPVPPGCLDASTYCKRPLTLGEAFQIASNIKRMEKQMGQRSINALHKYRQNNRKDDGFSVFVECIPIVIFVSIVIYAVIEAYILR